MTVATKNIQGLSDAPMVYPRGLDAEMLYAAPDRNEETARLTYGYEQLAKRAFIPSDGRGSLRSLATYLQRNGVGRHFTIHEVVTPNDRAKAKVAGYDLFVPPDHTWAYALMLLWIGDRLRHYAQSPVKLRNYWRPQSYNRLVSSSKITSDHPNACAMDFDFVDSEARERAQAWLEGFALGWGERLTLSIGYGAQTLHVGICSPLGCRTWEYVSFDGQRLGVSK